MTVANEIEGAVSRVPPWGWAVLAGGVGLIVLARHNKTAAAVLDPNAATVPLGTGTGTGGDPFGGGTGVTPGTTPDPGAGAVVSQPPAQSQKLTDIWGGDLTHLIGTLTNQPDYVDLQTNAAGSELTFSNTSTFGGGSGSTLTNPQYEIDRQNAAIAASHAQSQDALAQTQAWYDALIREQQGVWDATLGQWLAAHGGSGNGGGGAAIVRLQCHPGDTACAQRVWPTWDGSPIPGWT